jgi:hypothetical protein
MTTGIIIAIVIVLILLSSSNSKKKKQIEIETAKSKVESALKTGEINEEQKNILIEKIDFNSVWRQNIDEKIEAFKFIKKHQEALLQKYGEEIGSRLVNHQYWIGMTEEQLIECKGNPDKIEKQVLKTKTKLTYIYGNKSSGDYFVIENGEVVKFIDR